MGRKLTKKPRFRFATTNLKKSNEQRLKTQIYFSDKRIIPKISAAKPLGDRSIIVLALVVVNRLPPLTH